MITATDESVVTGIMGSNVVLGASLGITVSVIVLVILSLFVVIVKMNVSYNTLYNVSVEATLGGQENASAVEI
jgi:hypothetical protein